MVVASDVVVVESTVLVVEANVVVVDVTVVEAAPIVLVVVAEAADVVVAVVVEVEPGLLDVVVDCGQVVDEPEWLMVDGVSGTPVAGGVMAVADVVSLGTSPSKVGHDPDVIVTKPSNTSGIVVGKKTGSPDRVEVAVDPTSRPGSPETSRPRTSGADVGA